VSFLRRLFRQPERPAWASFMSAADYAAFADAVRAALAKHCPAHELDLAQGSWRPKADPDQTFGLVNAAQIFHAGGGPEAVDEFIAHTIAVRERSATTGPLSREESRPLLRVRLFPADLPQASLVTAPLSEAFITTLVHDFPDRVDSVVAENAAKWEVPTAVLFDEALENVWRNEPIEILTIPGPSGGNLRFGTADHFYAASHALLLDRHLGGEPEGGVLVAVPNRHVVMFHAVESAEALHILSGLPSVVRQMFEQGPGSVSPALLWARRGQFRVVEFAADGSVAGPAELVEALNAVTGSPESS
jgi:hypothetical protein